MADFATAIAENQNLSEQEQKRIGQASGDDMDAEHKNYLATIIGMLDRKEIRIEDPESLLKGEQYRKLGELDRNRADAALVNIVDQLRRIEEFYRSTQTPNASPELQNMIEHLWQMKNRIETKFGDVYKIWKITPTSFYVVWQFRTVKCPGRFLKIRWSKTPRHNSRRWR